MGVTRITIDLERSSGIFYGGEVVRGTVTFNVTGQVTARGFQIHLTGKSHVHWHTGGGDNRTDYDGTTVFQSQRHTLHGNYFKTGTIDNAGSDAYFGRANGDGTVLIPCEDRDVGRMELAVRVMDYDWGKRDDLLGEVLIDAADLARSGQMKAFSLQRNGRPEKGQVVLSAKFMPFGCMFPMTSGSGVRVSTNAVKSQCLVITVHSATGLRKADWGGKNDVYVQIYRPPKDVVPGKKLPGPDKTTQLPNGESTYPFAFQLRNDLPGSAELHAGDRAYVRYDLYAHAVFANWRDPCCRRTITVIPNRPVPMLPLLAPIVNETGPSPLYNCACCSMKCCREDGFASAKLSLDRRAYAPGEKIDLSGSVVVNDTKKALAFCVILRQYVVLRNSIGASTRARRDYPLFRSTCPARETRRFDGQNIAVMLPSVYPSFYGGVSVAPTRSHYASLKWTYTIEIKVGAEKGNCTSAIYARVPILVSTAPPYPEAVTTARKTIKSLTPADDPWVIFNEAINGPEPSDTTPKITGPEDGGSVVPAQDVGIVGTADFYEDKNSVGVAPSYQPVVNTFATVTAEPGPNVMANLNVEETAVQNPATTLSAIDSLVQPKEGSGVSALLSSLEKSYDKRRTVGEWVRDNPTSAQKLTPNDVAQVLSKVTFSLEQSSVAGELAAGFERGGGLTCEHIVAAMRACRYQSSDVAKPMAPYANDPQNKDLVLNELEYSFEKDGVAKLFSA